MHPYIPYIIADIKAAHQTEISEKENTPQSLEEHFEETETWVRGAILQFLGGRTVQRTCKKLYLFQREKY